MEKLVYLQKGVNYDNINSFRYNMCDDDYRSNSVDSSSRSSNSYLTDNGRHTYHGDTNQTNNKIVFKEEGRQVINKLGISPREV
jgi:hypothetical protein